MVVAAEKLAASLGALKTLQRDGMIAVRSVDLSRTHRERLLKAEFLVDKGFFV